MRDERALLTEFLSQNEAACDACGHGLKGILSTRCPECGRELRLAARAQDYTLVPWIGAMVSCALAAGFDGVCAFAASFMFFKHPPTWSMATIVLGCILGAYAATACLMAGIVWIYRRRLAWGRVERETQWRWAVQVFLGVLVPHALVGWWFFFSRV